MNSLYRLIPNKILLAILAGVVSIGSFQIWQYNQQKYNKFIAAKEKECEFDLDIADTNVKQSRSLRNLRYNQIANPGLEQPGINSEFEKGKAYLVISTKAGYIIPPNTSNYESTFFQSLSITSEHPPQPIIVRGVSINISKKQALVSSYCSSEPFVVPLENLYENFQPIDISN
ncbi:hypothetical protein H1Q63_20265 [Desmonostoc muscorum CCALA 125]|uniref:Uncharacterized protein n=1 Tax=Desmonostoc muscorum LEGE 12446 TaxID=1828758 RepID=A0A8J7A1M8_DESMC|nr:hypothetical protein [Desmonostoc muscorum]MBX9256235.1 hypothetical protein [Desmonostoc muscorum CCALA 125]MCF2151956.1 hypothetical protein [Desmonostoc muscorum LEGE 12446]